MASAEFHKGFPVDVLEEDGIFTRAFVQAVLENGDVSVDFDRKENSLRIVPAEAVRLHYCPDPDEMARRFATDEDIHVLFRDFPADARRWHRARRIKLKFASTSVCTILYPNGDRRKSYMSKACNHPCHELRRASASLIPFGFQKLCLAVPPEMEEAMERDDGFLHAFEEETGCLIEVEDTRGEARSIRAILPTIRCKLYGYEATENGISLDTVQIVLKIRAEKSEKKKRAAEMQDDSDAQPSKTKRARTDDSERTGDCIESKEDMVDDNAHLVFHIPELVNRVFYYMDMEQRDSLRRLWYDEMKSRSVTRIARHCISLSRTGDSEKLYARDLITTVLRGFTPRLETFVFSCNLSLFDEEDWPHKGDYFHLLPYLLLALRRIPCPALKKIVFCGGYMSQEMLSYFVGERVQIVLRKVFIRDPGMRFEHFSRKTRFFVYVEAGQTGRVRMKYPTRNRADRNVWCFNIASRFLADILDKSPVSPEEIEQIRVAIAGKTQPDRSLLYLEYVLKILNPQFLPGHSSFPRAVFHPKGHLHDPTPPRHTPDFRNLNLAALRPSTLRFFIVALDLYGPDDRIREEERLEQENLQAAEGPGNGNGQH